MWVGRQSVWCVSLNIYLIDRNLFSYEDMKYVYKNYCFCCKMNFVYESKYVVCYDCV